VTKNVVQGELQKGYRPTDVRDVGAFFILKANLSQVVKKLDLPGAALVKTTSVHHLKTKTSTTANEPYRAVGTHDDDFNAAATHLEESDEKRL